MPGIELGSEWIRDQFMRITGLCERIVAKQEEQDKRINKIEEKVDELRDKPSKRWESVVTAALTTIIGLLIGAYLIIPKV